MRVIWLLGVASISISSLAFSACNRSDEEKEGTAAPQNPASTGTALSPNTLATAGGAIGGPAPNSPVVGANTGTTSKPPIAADAGTSADAGASKDAGDTPKADGGTVDAGSANADKLKACAAKCQSVMQSCLTPSIPADGGFPQLKDPAACQAAAETCRASCTP